MKKLLSVIVSLLLAVSAFGTVVITSSAAQGALLYKIDFEEENAGTVMKANGELVGEVVEWPKGSGNHALKYVMDATTYKRNGVHPYIIPDGLSDALAQQGEIPAGGELYFTVDVGCDNELVTGNSEYGLYMYAMMLTASEGENFFANETTGTFVPGVGSFKTGEFSLSNYEVTPVAGTGNGLIALLDDGTLGAGMYGRAIYYDNITLEWYGNWKPITNCLLTYLDTKVPLAHSDINDAYTGSVVPTQPKTTTTKQGSTPTQTTKPSSAPAKPKYYTSSQLAVSADDITVRQGESFDLPIYIDNNPGTAAVSIASEMLFTGEKLAGEWGFNVNDITWENNILSTCKCQTWDNGHYGFFLKLNGKYAISDNIPFTTTGKICTIHCSCHELTPLGSYTYYLNVDPAGITPQGEITDIFHTTLPFTINVEKAPDKVHTFEMKGGDAYTDAGETFMYPLYITKNEGVSEFTVDVKYDSNALTFKKIGNPQTGFTDLTFEATPSAGSVKIHAKLKSGTYVNNSSVGVPIALQFTVSQTAKKGEYPVSLYINGRDVSAIDCLLVQPLVSPGKICVGTKGKLLGDATGDGNIDMKDVLSIRRYLSKLGSIASEENSDVNTDKSIDMKDVLMIRKYLAHIITDFVTASYVTDAYSYSVPYYQPGTKKVAGTNSVHIPQLNFGTSESNSLNRKILSKYKGAYDKLKAGTDSMYRCEISYTSYVSNNLVAVAVYSETGKLFTSMVTMETDYYYYSIDEDRELTFMEYLSALGLSYDDLIDYLEMKNEVNLGYGEYFGKYDPNVMSKNPTGSYPVVILGMAGDARNMQMTLARYVDGMFTGYMQETHKMGSFL